MSGPFSVLRGLSPLLDIEVPRGKGRAGSKAGRFKTPDAVGGRVERVVAKTPEVFVKVTGWSKTAGHASDYLDYISRDGSGEAVDEMGLDYTGDRALARDALRAWHLRSDKSPGSRKTMHLVLSMPVGTDPDKVMEGAKRFAHEEFHDRQYFLVFHPPGMKQTKTERSRTYDKHNGSPHVHFQVRSLNDQGERLRVGPKDLMRMREIFAEKMREQGVPANASPRLERGKTGYRRRDGNDQRNPYLENLMPRMRDEFIMGAALVAREKENGKAWLKTAVAVAAEFFEPHSPARTPTRQEAADPPRSR